MIAFLVLLSMLVYFLTQSFVVPLFLIFDFGLRSFDLGGYSPFARIADALVRVLNIGVKPIFYPPKRFAARVGLGFSLAILLLQAGGMSAVFLSGVLCFFAALESLAGICAGCYVYNWLLPLWQKFRSVP